MGNISYFPLCVVVKSGVSCTMLPMSVPLCGTLEMAHDKVRICGDVLTYFRSLR